MIDLETLATSPGATIVSIGVQLFHPLKGLIKKTFYRELDWKSQGREITADTIKWWRGQTPEARKAFNGTLSLERMLIELSEFLPDNTIVWGNGSIFDIAILENAYDDCMIDVPWKYYNIRDCRTVVDLYELKRGGLRKSIGGGSHNALKDATCQAKEIVKMNFDLVTAVGSVQ